MTLTQSRYNVLRKGNVAPAFDLIGVDNKKHSLLQYTGKKAYLVIFMCNHCPYVVPKFRYIKELFEKYESKGLAMFGINSNDTEAYGEDDMAHMKKYYNAQKFRFYYLLDETQETAKKYGATCTPDPFLFDSEKKLVYHGKIDDAHMKTHEEAKTNELEEAIQQVLEGKEVTVKEEPSMGCNIKWKN
ncbi:MAG: thioredoxin family protein [archaeon]|nr:thioredoxin family protein [archaeon]